MADNFEMQGSEEKALPKRKSGHFLREVIAELKKTTWLTKNELIKSTTTVLLTIVVVSIILFVYDLVASQLMIALGIATKSL